MFAALRGICEEGGLAAFEIVEPGEKGLLLGWRSSSPAMVDVSELVSARFPLGDEATARADLKFRWASATGDVSPQTEVLLQVVVDVVRGALLRTMSRLAPRPVPAPSPSPDRSSQPVHVDT